MTIKLPIRYAGGKSRALAKLETYFPPAIDEYREPFVGGGSVALHVASLHPRAQVWVNDLYKPLVCFWQALQKPETAGVMVERILKAHNETKIELKGRRKFEEAREILKDDAAADLDLACAYYLYNRLAFSGSSTSGFVVDNFIRWRDSEPRIRDLKSWTPRIACWRITNLDYADVMGEPWTGKSRFLFLDPPYQLGGHRGDKLYGNGGDTHRGFDQARFQALAEQSDISTLITLNAGLVCNFDGWPLKEVWDHAYSMVSSRHYRLLQNRRKELLLANYSKAGLKYEQRSQESQKPAATPSEIATLLQTLGISQTKAANTLGVTVRAVQFWIAGQRKVPDWAMRELRRLVASQARGRRSA